MSLNHNLTVRSLQCISHATLIIGLILANRYGVSILPYLWTTLIYILVVGTLGSNVGFHRLLSHKSFETWKPIEYFCAFLGTISLIGSPIAWSAAHRYHHAKSDQESDLHSPSRLGFFKAWFGIWPNVNIPARTVTDLTKDKFYRFLHKYYLEINLSYVVILYLIDPWLVVFVWAVHTVYSFHVTAGIAVLSHLIGSQNHNTNDNSKNNFWLLFVTHFEGAWHNNHHNDPSNYKQGHQWWQIDPPAWIIKLIKK